VAEFSGRPFGPNDIVLGKCFFNVSVEAKDPPTERRRVVAVMQDDKSHKIVYTLLAIDNNGHTRATNLNWNTPSELYEKI